MIQRVPYISFVKNNGQADWTPAKKWLEHLVQSQNKVLEVWDTIAAAHRSYIARLRRFSNDGRRLPPALMFPAERVTRGRSAEHHSKFLMFHVLVLKKWNRPIHRTRKRKPEFRHCSIVCIPFTSRSTRQQLTPLQNANRRFFDLGTHRTGIPLSMYEVQGTKEKRRDRRHDR
jgi:hypothetical protein